MPAGWPYFAWIDATETAFGSEHLRWDEQIFSFTLKQDEGDPASLTVTVRRPDGGLLAPGRKIWCWFALDCGPNLVRFRGRLVGIPTSIFEELVTLEFVARPLDMVAQKEALADTLRVLPYYDEAVIDPSRRTDPDVVLEGYTKIWHFDRETHVVTVSDELIGEDGQVNFLCDNGDVLHDGLGLKLTTGPLAVVDVSAEFTWTQQAEGTVDLTRYLTSNWPGAVNGIIRSYSLYAADWPKTGAGIGDGWTAASASATDFYDHEVRTTSRTTTLKVQESTGETTGTATLTESESSIAFGAGQEVGITNFKDDVNVSYATDGDGEEYPSSVSHNRSTTVAVLVFQEIQPTLVAGYKAERHYTERVSFSLFANVQPILTDPQDGEALRIDNIRSINLSEAVDGNVLIGDPARRSYIATARGARSIEHLIAVARAHLLKRARVVEISFAPKLARMPEVTLRKSAFLSEPRIGEALGKIIGYSIELDGADGAIKCKVSMGCAIGYGGTVTATEGTPTYCTIDYCGPDYQVFTGRTVMFPADTSVAYSPPIAAPNDDGIDFLSALTVADVLERPLVVENGPDEQKAALQGQWPDGAVMVPTADTQPEQAQQKYFKDLIKQYETRATFKLKPVTGQEFTTEYQLQVSDLEIPTGYDLEAV